MAEQELSLPPQPAKSSASSDHSNLTLHSSAAKLSHASSIKLLNQVEHYFSDFNVATTDHLMRLISKDPEGFVPISVVASLKKIKALVNGHRQIATILRNSSKLVISEDGKKVRRLHPITESEMEDLQSRIIVAENLPEEHSRQNLLKVFSAVGSVKAIRTCQPQAPNCVAASVSRSTKFDNMRFSNKLHAFVEYESAELAEKAVAELNNKGNGSGLRVRLMVKQMVGSRNKRSYNNNKKKKKKTTRYDNGGGGDGCFNNITPLNRSKTSEKLDSNSLSEKEPIKTPPIQTTVSPEIQHLQVSLLSSSSSTTPGCYTYAAGHHVLSGITDKRKCRPKGLLAAATVQNNHSVSKSHFDSIEDASLPLPSPTHASMLWLRLSPSDTYNHNDDSSLDTSSKSLCSTPPLLFSRSSCASPISFNSLGTTPIITTTSGGSSGNIISTPSSDSAPRTHTYVDDLLCISTATPSVKTFTSQLDSIAQCLHTTSLSSTPNTSSTTLDVQSYRDSVSIGSSFQFETLTASYTSTDLTHFRQLEYDHNSCCSSQSGMMTSSRDMLLSEIYEMDEFDFCRCLSDEEGHDANNACIDADIFSQDLRVEDKDKQCQDESYPHGSCAESISTDEDCWLASSTDSNCAFELQKQ